MCTVHLFCPILFLLESLLFWRTVPTIILFSELPGSRKVFLKNCLLSHLVPCRNKGSSVSSQRGLQDLLQFDLFVQYKEKLEEHSRCLRHKSPKINSKLCRLLWHVLYKRTSRATRKKLFVNCYIGVRKKCFLAIHYDTFPQFPDCCKFISTSSLCSCCLFVKSDISQN